MIKITQQQDKWKIEIVEELWEFNDRAAMEKELKMLFDMKDKFGRIRK